MTTYTSANLKNNPASNIPGEAFLAYVEEVAGKEPTRDHFTLGYERAQDVLAYVELLRSRIVERDAEIEQLREVIAFNRTQHDRMLREGKETARAYGHAMGRAEAQREAAAATTPPKAARGRRSPS